MAVVLLIDDDVDIIEANKSVLSSRGHKVRVAYSAAEAKDLLSKEQPVAAVIDVMMESKDAGFELARHIHETYPKLPAVILSGIRSEMSLKFDFESDETWLPVVKFLEKPVDPSKLADEVEALIAG